MSDFERDWILRIKETRAQTGASILDAERQILRDRKWRRWVAMQVASNDRCLKYAKSHIKYNGEDALFALDGREVIFKELLED